MPIIARIIGGAGTGKTTALMDTMERVLESGIDDPLSVGFVSFTKAARREASERAAARFGGKAEQLEDEGWFRTLHSVCYRLLGVKQGALILDNKADEKWLAEALGEQASCAVYDGIADVAFNSSTDAGKALGIWDYARNRLIPYREAHERAWRVSDSTPAIEDCLAFVEKYEQAKRLDDRCDFVDMLGRFAGYRFDVDGHSRRTPEGVAPSVPVWFFDEQQDTSPLLDAVCRRLMEPAQWVYVVGDPFQSIYGWAGAMGTLFMGWEVAKEKTLPKSYRCPAPIHYLGEDILRECSDYFDRGIQPADHDGEVETVRFHGGVLDEVDPRESWLLLARTNYHAARLSRRLKESGVPWLPTKGNGGWNAPARHEATESLYGLERGLAVRGSRWKRVIEHLPAKLLERGAKTRWADMKQAEADEQFDRPKLLDELPGATPEFVQVVRSGQWREHIDHADEWCSAVERFGEEAVKNPKVRVGTIHSVKGAEADNVLWLTTLTNQVRKGREDQEVDDEERRLAYVAVTRARHRLVVAVEPNAYRFEVPA